MPYNSLLDRTDSGPLIPEEVEREIFQHVPETSAVMRLSRRLRDMARQERTLRVLDGLATAYFVGHSTAASGDNARIQTSEITWANKYIRAAKLGVIVPVPIDVAEDVDYDLWGEIRPQLTEAFGRTFDAAVFYGTGAPSDWPADLVTGATAAGNVVSLSNLPEGSVDFYDAVLSENGTVSKVEENGYLVSGHVSHMGVRGKMRGARDSGGHPIFTQDPTTAFRYYLDGEPVIFPRNGVIDPTRSLLISGDWTQLVYALRKGVTFEILREASIHDAEGQLVYNLAQDDMRALKAVMRLGWELPNPPNRLDATPYPFGVLKP